MYICRCIQQALLKSGPSHEALLTQEGSKDQALQEQAAWLLENAPYLKDVGHERDTSVGLCFQTSEVFKADRDSDGPFWACAQEVTSDSCHTKLSTGSPRVLLFLFNLLESSFPGDANPSNHKRAQRSSNPTDRRGGASQGLLVGFCSGAGILQQGTACP